MQKHKWWRAEYRKDRYLEYLSATELATRTRDVLNNLVNITSEGKLGFHEINPAGEAWLLRFTQILEEYSLRGQGLPSNIMQEHQLPNILRPRNGKLIREGKSGWARILPSLPKESIVKYGHLKHLQPLLECGKTRLCPASHYKDLSLGPHRYDDERVRTTHHHPSGSKIQLIQRADGSPVHNAPEASALGNISIRREVSDYYVWCASGALEPRLFIDFDHANACLIIHDIKEFAKRLGWAASNVIVQTIPSVEHIGIEWKGIQYFDPFFPPKLSDSNLPVPWSKPMRYAYQKEYRFVVEEFPLASMDLPILNLHLGPLCDIAEIVYVGELEGHFHHGRNSIVQV